MDEATHIKNFKPINLRDLFMGKNPKAGRWIPYFVFRILSRFLRIDFFNDAILYKHGYKKNVDFSRSFPNVKVLANTRKFLGIKVNLERFFLPNESYKHRNKHFVITFGKPIPFSTFDKRHTPAEWAFRVLDYTYTLADNPEGLFA